MAQIKIKQVAAKSAGKSTPVCFKTRLYKSIAQAKFIVTFGFGEDRSTSMRLTVGWRESHCSEAAAAMSQFGVLTRFALRHRVGSGSRFLIDVALDTSSQNTNPQGSLMKKVNFLKSPLQTFPFILISLSGSLMASGRTTYTITDLGTLYGGRR